MRSKLLCLFGVMPFLVAFGFAANSTAPLSREYQKWLDEDVRWIITSQERRQFLQLTTDKARDEFVVAFWRRHDVPGTKGKAFKAEHYRRLEFVNEHFAGEVPGWETDRGRTYIVYGPPDQKGIAAPHAIPTEIWTYKQTKTGPLSIKFMDSCRCGKYQLAGSGPTR